jgi:hypothetical protein
VLGVFISRALLVALPFAVYFGWRELARRRGREIGATPWAWLFAAGMVLVGLSLMATVVFHGDNRGHTYVPAEAQPGGAVRPSRFDPERPIPLPADTAPNTAP